MVVESILGLSIIIQLVAAAMALRLIRVTGWRLAWAAIAAGLILMAARRAITFYGAIAGTAAPGPDLSAELVALAISVLMVVGVHLLGEFFARASEAEHAVRESEEHHRALVEMSPDAIVVCDLDRVVFANAAAARLHGAGSPTEMIGRDWLDFVDPDDREEARQRVENATSAPSDFVLRRRLRMDGSVFHAEVGIARITWQGKPAVVGMFRDMSDRVRAEETLRRSEELFRQISESVRHVSWITDHRSDRPIYISPAFEEIWGRSLETIGQERRAFADSIVPEDRERVLAALDRRATGDYDEEYQIERPDGTRRWIRDRAFPIHDETGAVYRVAGVAEDITDRKEMLDALRDSEARYRALVELSPDGIIVNGGERVVFANEAAAKLFGYGSPEDLVGTPWIELLHPNFRDVVAARHNQILGSVENVGTVERQCLRRDGTAIHVQSTVGRIPWEGGSAVLVVLRDMSERLRARRALEDSEQRYRSLVEAGSDWIWELNAEGTFVYSSPRGEEILGYTSEEMIGKRPSDISPPEEIGLVRNREAELLVSPAPFRLANAPRMRKDGSIVVLETSGAPVFDEFGEFRGYRGISRDVTDRVRAEEAIRQSEALLRQVIDLVPHRIYARDRSGRYLLANLATASVNDMTPDELVGKLLHEVHDNAEECERFLASDRSIFESKEAEFVSEQSFTASNGEVRSFQTTKIPLTMPGTSDPAVLGVSVDITERKRAEQALKESEERYRSLVEQVPDAITISVDGRIIFANLAAGRIYGVEPAEKLVGMSIRDFIHPDDLELFEHRYVQLESGRGPLPIIEQRRRRFDGTEVIIQSAPSTIVWQGRRAILGVNTDITARKRAEATARLREAELRFVQRISSMGQLSSALAHEINQPLAATMGYVQASRRLLQSGQAENSERIGDLMGKAVAQTERCATIIRRMRGLMERNELVRRRENVNEVIEEACGFELLGPVRDEIELKFDLAANLSPIPIDRIQIQLVIMNLVRNGIEAMESSEQQELVIKSNADNRSIIVTVKDSGAGFADNITDRFFDPFITTKTVGMGFGLSISRSVIEAHGGRIWMSNNQDGGATVGFSLPLDRSPE